VQLHEKLDPGCPRLVRDANRQSIEIDTGGIDSGKSVLHLVGLSAMGEVTANHHVACLLKIYWRPQSISHSVMEVRLVCCI